MNRILARDDIAENLRFMVFEATRQVENARKVLEHRDEELIAAMEAQDDYIDNLKSIIENKCYSAIHYGKAGDKRVMDLLRAAITVTTNLERVADFAVNVVMQTQYLKDPEFILRYGLDAFFKEVLQALNAVYPALAKQDMSLAFGICRAEFTLDRHYKIQFDRILNELRSGRETENLITSHLILRYLERMGDALLNIGEAIIFSAIGEKFKIRQYEALKENLAQSGLDIPISNIEFQSIWGTRSGCRISKLAQKQADAAEAEADQDTPASGVLFKEGSRRKILLEKQSIERWEWLMPGLPPRVLSCQEKGSQASLLLEFLGGCTFQDIVLGADLEIVNNALFLVEQTLHSIWDITLTREPARAGFISQLKDRLDQVFQVHPGFRRSAKRIGDLLLPSLETLIDEAAKVDEELAAPYSVFIHGDFNINNIVYDHVSQKIHFIDLYRSRQTDPVQDISVFLVSNFRLPFFDNNSRQRLDKAIVQLFRFAKEYARAHGDACFDARLALGLARSFITSTRLELSLEFAKIMFLRGVHLLERLTRHRPRPWEDFTLHEFELSY